MKLTPALRHWLKFIASDPKRGRIVLQITATGARASAQLQSLRNAGYVEYWDDRDDPTGPIACVSPKPAREPSPPLTYPAMLTIILFISGRISSAFCGATRRTADRRGNGVDPISNGRGGSRPATLRARRSSAAASQRANVNGADLYHGGIRPLLRLPAPRTGDQPRHCDDCWSYSTKVGTADVLNGRSMRRAAARGRSCGR